MAQAYSAYAFTDIAASIFGPGGAFPLGQDAGVADGGISIEMLADKDTLVFGADGSPMHSLHAAQGGTITIRLLKVSGTNFLLSTLYAFQASSSANWGLNTIVISDLSRGDLITCDNCAFKRQPANTYATEGNIIEWAFNSGRIVETLGTGTTLVL